MYPPISSPPDPASDASAGTTSHTQGRFRITTRKLPISKAGVIDALTEQIGIPMPEMIFGDNLVSVTHVPTGWSLSFATPAALDAVDKTDKRMLKVAYARDWESTRESATQGIKDVVKPYDWSYSTDYAGTLSSLSSSSSSPSPEDSTPRPFAASEKPIPIELLKRRDPILFFDDVMLYESELDDNGTSVFSVKVRVHEKRMLLLCRLFMRLDNVLVRVRDTRVYVDFETDEVIREYTAQEESFEKVKRVRIEPRRTLKVNKCAGILTATATLHVWQTTRRHHHCTPRSQRVGAHTALCRAAERGRQPGRITLQTPYKHQPRTLPPPNLVFLNHALTAFRNFDDTERSAGHEIGLLDLISKGKLEPITPFPSSLRFSPPSGRDPSRPLENPRPFSYMQERKNLIQL